MPDLIEWIDPDGMVYPLDGSWSLQVLFGLQGRFSGPVNFLEQALPLDDGSLVNEVWVAPGEITLPWDMLASSEAEMRSWLDQALWAFAPWRGMGKLRSTRSDGSGVVREYRCYLKSGFDTLQEAITNGFAVNAPRHSLVFRGGPFWEDASPLTIPLTTESGAGTFLPIAFPWHLASSTVFASYSFINDGHKEVWPNTYVRGPGENFKITDTGSGDFFRVGYSIPEGDAIRIDLREPGNRRVYVESTGEDLAPLTTGDPFSLPIGTTQLQFELGSATDASLIQLEAYRRWSNP